jgi:competence protein ComEC
VSDPATERRRIVSLAATGWRADADAVALAVAVVAGAWLSWPVPLVVAGAAVVLALGARHPAAVAVAALLLASCLGARAWSGIEAPPPGPHDGVVTLLTDPEPAFGAVRAEVRVGERRLDAWVRGAGAGRFATLLAGERVRVRGRVEGSPQSAPWLVPRHVVGRLVIDEVGPSSGGDLASRVANGLRRTLVRGAESLADDRRALFTGFVLGDDRGQDPLVADDFDGAGLTHLLAVSGQNVAFVLVVVGPLVRRLGLRGRLVVTLAVLAFFALATRFEPSVLRATAMAAIATIGVTLARRASPRRVLALAIAALVLVDPLLVHAVGFLLSVGAATGIVLLARPLAEVVPGPRVVAEALAVTMAAQLGVAPVLVPVFGGVPVASIPANLLAGPASGPIMVWGLTGGLAAGVVGAPLAALLHVPTGLLLAWVATVARQATGLGLGEWGASHLLVLAGAGAALVVGRRRRARPVVVAAAVVVGLGAALHPVAAVRSGPAARVEVAPGATVHRGVVLVLAGSGEPGAPGPSRVLEGLRRADIRSLELVVTAHGGARAAETVALVRRRFSGVAVLAPPGHRVPGADAPRAPWSIEVAGVRVVADQVAADTGRLHLTVRPP